MVGGLLKITGLTLIIAVLEQVMIRFDPPFAVDDNFWLILIFFFLQTIVIHVLFTLGKSELDLGIPLLVMAITGFRLLTALMAVVIFILLGVSDVTSFVITFFVLYLFYFVFEIISVLSNLRSNSKQG